VSGPLGGEPTAGGEPGGVSAVRDGAVCTRLRVEGTVQGVGFRPFVHRLANDLGLDGWVLNDSNGVLIEAQGPAEVVERLAERIYAGAPPLAVIERISVSAGEGVTAGSGFLIRPSPAGDPPNAPVTPDSATCEDCLRELFDPRDRRHRYPFINCTNCGPRFTIVRGVPYDRLATTMAAFSMCERCRAEYEDPADRRFHAQPNACPACGPSLSLQDARGRRPAGILPEDPLVAAAVALRDGAILAVKGIGGYHLACRADNGEAVFRLRSRKHREDKPFALMVRTLADAEVLVELDDAERELLRSPARPIVLAPRRTDACVAEEVAPGVAELGVMLAYSPLHHLLLADFHAQGGEGALVLTSANVSDEPIAYRDQDARRRLAAIADLFLVHDREIHTRTDDSVVRVVSVAGHRRPLMVRRSRGYVPTSIPLPGGVPAPLLACGAQLKCTFCLARGERAWVSHHIGDLENYETLVSYTEGIDHFQRLFDVSPEVVVHDLHPEYLSTKHALSLEGPRSVGVQHHHAHLAACLAEHGERGVAVGAIFDGTGHGLDGTVWGGEILVGDAAGFERAGWLAPVPLPGGERAIQEPWRMALAWLDECLPGTPALPAPIAARGVTRSLWRQVLSVARAGAGVAAPSTSSIGRLLDGVAALCGLRAQSNYEGQAAIELEAACDPHERGRYEFELMGAVGALVLDPRPALRALLDDQRRGAGLGVAAARFHNGLAAATVEALARVAEVRGLGIAVLSGGVFNNRRLLEAVSGGLGRAGLRVLVPSLLPVGDGGISFGQAAVAAELLRREATT
jgi:hydrogenase maturation protein HypF